MQYTVNRGGKGKVEVKVDIPQASFVLAYNDIIGKLGSDSKISGFRPGKVPHDVVENQFGINKVLNEAASYLVSQHLSDIFKKENIIPIANPNIAVHSLAKDAPFSFTATLASKPEVKISGWKKIKIKKVKAKEVTEEDINKSIENIFQAYQKQEETKRTKGLEEEPEEEGQKSGKFIYDAQGNKVFLGEKKTLRSSSSQDSTAGLKRYVDDKESKSESEAKSTKVDDEFAKKIGARDLAHLKELVKNDLEKIMLDQVEAKLEQELFDEMLKLVNFDVPDILVDDELNRIILRITQNLESQKRKLEDYLKEENTTLDALKAKLRPQAEKNVKITLVMDEIGRGEGLKVTPEEIENAAKGVDQTKLDEKQKADLKNYLAISIFQAKSLDFVKKAVAV